MAIFSFLFLSLVSGAVEIGGVIAGIRSGFPVLEVVGLGLAYQIGNLVPNPLRLGKGLVLAAGVGSAACLTLAAWGRGGFALTFVGYALAAVSIQSLRAVQKEKVGTTLKRLCRIAGFLLAPFMGFGLAALVGVVVVALLLTTRWPPFETRLVRPTLRFLSAVMIIHQVHYFSYAYFIVLVLSQGVKNPFLIGVLFVLGWLTYTSVSHILRGGAYARYLVFGHLFLAAVLLALGSHAEGWTAAVLWVLTGFGGGTVFCIEKLNKLTRELTKSDLTFAENIGHIVGVLLGMGAYLLSRQASGPIYLAASAAAATALLGTIYAGVRVYATEDGVAG